MSEGEPGCPFCFLEPNRVVIGDETAFAVRDKFPVSPGHTLIIPTRHVANWWDATAEEHAAMLALLDRAKAQLDEELHPDGYNVGINDGAAAGQTVFHLHMHLIPRYDGDVEDPREGVRHVLAAHAQDMIALSEPEARLQELLATGDLVRHVLALLDEGRRSATYKPALLLALVELAAERVDGLGELRLPLDDIAERVMELYWQQTRPHPDSGVGVLRQVTASKSRIIGSLVDLRTETGCAVNASIGHVRLSHPDAYAKRRDAIARALAMQPIPRLQRPGPGDTYPRFLYDDSDFVSEAGWRGAGEPVVVLRAGVAQALAASTPLLRMAAEDVWTREVVAINRLQTQEELLRSFLFGTDRTALGPVAEALRDAGQTHCFWCDDPLRDAEVDHVIPWSHYPSDDLYNLVLADPACNSDKRDRLVTADLVARWRARDTATLGEIAAELRWPMNGERSTRVASSAYRFLPSGVPVWGGVQRLELFDERQRDRIAQLLVC